ncbi:MAG: PfkB family carbohydrate kinase [Acidobacteriota bacterium]
MIDKKSFFKIIEQFEDKKIVVWGDFILDEFIYTRTSRVSREAPVIILKFEKKELDLGGAANSIKNILELGGNPIPIGFIGKDSSGEKLKELFSRKKIETKYLIEKNDYKTPTKTRILAGGEHTYKQQVLRIDYEAQWNMNKHDKECLIRNLKSALVKSDALIISDYDYGNIPKSVSDLIINHAKKMKIPVSLDSRHRLLDFYGVTVATPNEPEVEECLKVFMGENEDKIIKSGEFIMKKLGSPALLITRGYKGMILFQRNSKPLSIPVFGSTDIVDVTGAGDTVISTFTLSLVSGGNFYQSAILSNLAGGVVVMKKGAATLTRNELKETVNKYVKTISSR